MLQTTSHSQGQVIACLEEKLASSKIVSHTCVKQIYRLLELQADDFNMDRHLYLSCKDDRELLCETVRVYMLKVRYLKLVWFTGCCWWWGSLWMFISS